jgi:hypothetical protein
MRSHSLRAWAIGRAQMAIPSKECTLLRTSYNTGMFNADAVTEAPLAAARDDSLRAHDVDDAAPLVTAEGRLAATWAENPDAALASLSSDLRRLWSGYVMPLALG